jgi:hypothetical protein
MRSPTQRQEAAFAALRGEVIDEGGVMPLRMSMLRDRLGVFRTGPHVRDVIAELLARNDLRHLPADLPCDQDELVHLYSMETDAGRTLAVALRLARSDRGSRSQGRAA